MLVPEVGGRIMGLRWRGHELAFVNPELAGRVDNVAAAKDVRTAKRDLGFLLWGGDKTWLAPQDRWTDGLPFLDLDSGAYGVNIGENGGTQAVVAMTSPVCRETGMRIVRTVSLRAGEDGWTVSHRLENPSDHAAEWAPWGVAMIRRPARVYLPLAERSRYPGGIKTFAREGESVTARETVVSDLGGVARITCADARKFKFGTDGEVGSALAVMEVAGLGLVGLAKEVPRYHPRPYGHGCVAEVFNSSDHAYLEVEMHGPVVTLAHGESFELIERAALFDLRAWPETAAEALAHLDPGASRAKRQRGES